MKASIFSLLRFLFLFSAFLLLTSSGGSQTPPVLPEGPLLVPAPQSSCWEIQYVYKADPGSKGKSASAKPARKGDAGKPVSSDPRPLSVKVTKTPDVLYEETHTASGDTWSRWHYGLLHLEILQPTGNSRALALNSLDSKNSLVSSYQKNDFPDFDWISAANFRGMKKVGKVDCLFFSDDVVLSRKPTVLSPSLETGSEESAPPPKVKILAWISAKTHLPVKWQCGSETRRFQFGPLAPIPELPPECKRLFELNTTPPPAAMEVSP